MAEPLLLAVLTFALTFSIARFTPLHPLIAAALGGLLWAGLGTLIMLMFAAEAWMIMAILAFVAGICPSGLGAFAGWLVKTQKDRGTT